MGGGGGCHFGLLKKIISKIEKKKKGSKVGGTCPWPHPWVPKAMQVPSNEIPQWPSALMALWEISITFLSSNIYNRIKILFEQK